MRVYLPASYPTWNENGIECIFTLSDGSTHGQFGNYFLYIGDWDPNEKLGEFSALVDLDVQEIFESIDMTREDYGLCVDYIKLYGGTE